MRQDLRTEDLNHSLSGFERGQAPTSTNASRAASDSVSSGTTNSVQDPERAAAMVAVEDYLDQVCLPLVNTMPYAARAEMRREVSSHLKALADAYEEIGDPPALATKKALAKFGSPDKVARLWQRSVGADFTGDRTIMPRVWQTRRWLQRQWPGMAVTMSAFFLLAGLFVPLRPMTTVSSTKQIESQTGNLSGSTGSITALSGFHHAQAVQYRNCVDCHRSPMTAQQDRRFLVEQTRQWMNSRQFDQSEKQKL